MSGITTRKSYTKIKNFTEKDQVRIKYSHIGKDKKLMLSVYIGEDVYTELTKGYNFKRLKVEYIPNDMVIITPTNEEKEGIVHRYNGKGMFKTTCVRLSLSSYKTLKLRKKDFNNRVIGYNIWLDKAHIYGCNKLKVDLIGDKRKLKLINKLLLPDHTKPHIEVPIDDIPLKEFMSIRLTEDIKPIDISPTGIITSEDHDVPSREYIEDSSMFVSHDFLNDVRDSIENRLLGIEERLEKRIMEFEDNFIFIDFKIMNNPKINKLEEDVNAIVEKNVSAIVPKELDIDTLKQLLSKATDEMNIKFSKLEKEIVNLVSKSVDINARLNLLLQNVESKTDISLDFREIKNILNDIKKSQVNKSLMKRIFGKE